MVVFPPPVGTHSIDLLCLDMDALSSSIACIWYGLKVCIFNKKGLNGMGQASYSTLCLSDEGISFTLLPSVEV
jgi:hypothetical protein